MKYLLKNWTVGQIISFATITFLFILLATVNLAHQPPPWWDEGWTMSLAKNWVELGHYGHLIMGQFRPPGLNAAFPVVAPIALSFNLFDIGVLQSRLPSVIYLCCCLILIFYLAYTLYNRPIAIGAIFVLFFLSGPAQLHPLVLGRTVLAEMPMLFYLLAGYTMLYLTFHKSHWWMILAVLFWSIAINTKLQVLPFWLASLLLPAALMGFKRLWRLAGLLLIVLIFSWFASIGLMNLVKFLIPQLAQTTPLPGLVKLVAVVLDLRIRRYAMFYVVTIGLPTLAGFIWASLKTYKNIRLHTQPDAVEITRLSLLAFMGSWLAWYAFLALYTDRYLFPVVFVGSIFTSGLLYQLTFQFNFKKTFQNASAVFLRSRSRENIGALIMLPVIVLLTFLTIQFLFTLFTMPGVSIAQVTDYIERITDENDLIETYESELFFLLDRPYHYPPDDIELQILSSETVDNEIIYDYNPLTTDPDYLIIGYFGKKINLYDQMLATGEFIFVDSVQGYDIYSRNR
jgi:hypothetical protein